LWRGRALAAIVDAPLISRGLGGFLPGGDQAMSALRHLLEGNGTGASGIVFFSDPADRDTKLLQALRDALDLAASPAFAAAFGGSNDLADYRWGRLHRIVFRHPLGGPFSIPPGAGFTNLGTGLPGVATDGGFGVVDASSHNPSASTLNGFMFGSGPARRFVSEARTQHPNAVQVIPGGESGNPAGQWFGNQLGLWLTNEYHRATTVVGEVQQEAAERDLFTPQIPPRLNGTAGASGGGIPQAGASDYHDPEVPAPHVPNGREARALGRKECREFKQNFGQSRSQFGRCIAAVAMALRTNASPREACAKRRFKRRRQRGERRSDFSACVIAAARALREQRRRSS
ncbi:MAG TPA: penicillin acylase family protein, partial [Solirubrobacterales bacterium]